MITDEKSNEYAPQYDPTIPLEKQQIKKEALSMIALFHLNYWCNSQEEKQELRDIFNENEIKYQAELKEKYNQDDLFKNKRRRSTLYTNNETIENCTNIRLIKHKESLFVKFKNFIFKILHINKI